MGVSSSPYSVRGPFRGNAGDAQRKPCRPTRLYLQICKGLAPEHGSVMLAGVQAIGACQTGHNLNRMTEKATLKMAACDPILILRVAVRPACLGAEDALYVKWFECMGRSLKAIPSHVTVVTVCDREADIYGFIRRALLEEKPILIRAVYNRRVIEEQRPLLALVDNPAKTRVAGAVLRSQQHAHSA